MSRHSGEAFEAGERIAKLSVLTLAGIGVVELAAGALTGSLGVRADGIGSLADSLISLIVWVGLHYSSKRADDKFHFGYQKVESLSALMMSIGMIGVAIYLFYQSYLTFIEPRGIHYAPLALVTLLAAALISLYRAFQMRTTADRYGLLSLRVDANNSMKDGIASFIVFGNLIGASLGFKQLDAVGGTIVGVYVASVAYVALRESSLILLDAFENPELVSVLRSAIRTVDGVRDLESIKLRPSGLYITGIIAVLVDGSMTVSAAHRVRAKLLDIISTIIEPVGEMNIIFNPSSNPQGN